MASWRERQGLAFGQINRDAEVIEESLATVGGTVMGRRMFDEGEVPWADNPPFRAPVFVLTHDPRETLVKQGGTTFTFVTDGVHSALEQARAAAGDRDVAVAGGAHDIREFIQAGLLDELEIHLAPVLLAADADSSRTWARSASNSRTQGLSTRGESRISSFAS